MLTEWKQDQRIEQISYQPRMTAIFKSRRQETGKSMKHLVLMHVLLLFLGAGLFLGPATAELTASQNVPPTANVGENVMVTVMLTYSGSSATPASITPGLSPGLETNFPGGSTELYPGVTAPISYPIRAVQSGTYLVTSQVSYAEEGTWRNLRLESPFTATGQIQPGGQQPNPGQEMPGAWPQNSNPFVTNPNGPSPYGASFPGTIQNNGTIQNGTIPLANPGMNPGDNNMLPPGVFMPEGMSEGVPDNTVPESFEPEQNPAGDVDQASGPNGE